MTMNNRAGNLRECLARREMEVARHLRYRGTSLIRNSPPPPRTTIWT